MGLLTTLLQGRPNGLRATLRRLLGAPAPAAGASTTNAASATSKAQATAPPRPVAAERALNLGLEAPKDVTPPEGFEVVLHRDALKPGEVIEVIIAGKAIAVGNVDGVYHAVSNTCPHADGPLGEGKLKGTTLTCPYHGWEFDITDGSCLTSPRDTIKTFPVSLVQTAVCVKL